MILYNENKAPLKLIFVNGHNSLTRFLNLRSQTGQRLVPGAYRVCGQIPGSEFFVWFLFCPFDFYFLYVRLCLRI
jgi:hypothetical protein